MIPDVETQFEELFKENQELLKEVNYWRNQAITLRERNVALKKENKLMDEIINEEYEV